MSNRELIEKLTFALLKANQQGDTLGVRAETAKMEKEQHSKAIRAFMHDLLVDYVGVDEADFEVLEKEIAYSMDLQYDAD